MTRRRPSLRWPLATSAIALTIAVVVACGRDSSPAAPSRADRSTAAGGMSLAVAGLTVVPGGGTVQPPAPPAPLTLDQLFALADTDHDGFISRAEWRLSGRHPKNFDARDIREPFNLLDLGEFKGQRE